MGTVCDRGEAEEVGSSKKSGLSEARPSQAKQAAERCTSTVLALCCCLEAGFVGVARIDMPALATPAPRHQAIATKQVASLSWSFLEPSFAPS